MTQTVLGPKGSPRRRWSLLVALAVAVCLGLFWVTGAPILPRNYGDPSQPIRGYLLAAQPFRLALLGLGPGDVANSLTFTGIDASREAFPTQVEEASGGADERMSGLVLFAARRFADQHDFGRRLAVAVHLE